MILLDPLILSLSLAWIHHGDCKPATRTLPSTSTWPYSVSNSGSILLITTTPSIALTREASARPRIAIDDGLKELRKRQSSDGGVCGYYTTGFQVAAFVCPSSLSCVTSGSYLDCEQPVYTGCVDSLSTSVDRQYQCAGMPLSGADANYAYCITYFRTDSIATYTGYNCGPSREVYNLSPTSSTPTISITESSPAPSSTIFTEPLQFGTASPPPSFSEIPAAETSPTPSSASPEIYVTAVSPIPSAMVPLSTMSLSSTTSAARFSSSSTSSSTSSQLASIPGHRAHNSVAAIAGGTVGGAVGLAFIGIILWFCVAKRRKGSESMPELPSTFQEKSSSPTKQYHAADTTVFYHPVPQTQPAELYAAGCLPPHSWTMPQHVHPQHIQPQHVQTAPSPSATEVSPDAQHDAGFAVGPYFPKRNESPEGSEELRGLGIHQSGYQYNGFANAEERQRVAQGPGADQGVEETETRATEASPRLSRIQESKDSLLNKVRGTREHSASQFPPEEFSGW